MLLTKTSLVLSTFFIWSSEVVSQNGPSWTATPFNPPALPLAVRSPYLNTWVGQGNDPGAVNNLWPKLWDNNGITGWYSSVVVDGQAYRILGDAPIPNVENANLTAVELTATRTSFLLTAGAMQINASFISPVEPTDLVRQSLPFSYLSISATSTDGNAHNLRTYSDISGEFIAGNTTDIAQWTSEDDDQYVVLSMRLQTQTKYAEIVNHPQDATEYYSLKKISGTTTSWAITADVVNRANAANTSVTLGNTADETPRGVSDNWPVLGISVDWGSVKQTQEPAIWAIGVVRSPSILYRNAGSLEERYPYFLSVYSDGPSATKAFLDDFSRAQTAAAELDAQIRSSGSQISPNYANLLTLSTRQAFGSLDITISKAGDGSWNTSDVKAFMKNTGGAGSDFTATSLSVNTADVLYAAFPVFLYLNPELGGYLLSPLLEYQDSPAYTLNYASKSIGSAYPNATADGPTAASEYSVEESSNMLIMTLAYSQRSGNGTFLSKHYSLLRGWASFLENSTLTPTNQRSADFIPDTDVSDSQSNLALKGIIAIASMAKIAEAVGISDDKDHFNNVATSLISQWQNNALSKDNSHINLFYGKDDSSGLIYNLYPDKLLQLNLVSSSVYDVASTFYTTTADQAQYGIPLDNSNPNRTATNWMLFAASTISNTKTRDKMISQVHAYAASNLNAFVFATSYNPIDGTALTGSNDGRNSPASGAMFALLAVNTTIKSISVPSGGLTTLTSTATTSTSTNPGGDSQSSAAPKPTSSAQMVLAGTVIVAALVPLLSVLLSY